VTVGSVSTEGTSPTGPFSDSIGPLAKDPEDLAALLGVLTGKDFSSDLTRSWEGQRIAFVNPDDWELSSVAANHDDALQKKEGDEIRASISKMEVAGAKVVRNVTLPTVFDFEFKGREGLESIWNYEFKSAVEKFFQGYVDPPVKSLEDLIQFNIDHKDIELPDEWSHPQNQLEDALHDLYSKNQYEEAKAYVRKAGRSAFDSIFSEHDVDIVAGPLDGRIVSTAACAGYPVCTVPLGYAPNMHGRAYGVTAVAGKGEEGKLIQFMSAWAAKNPDLWQAPPMLVNWEREQKHNL